MLATEIVQFKLNHFYLQTLVRNQTSKNLVVPPLRDFVADQKTVETIEKVIHEMLKTTIRTEAEMRKFLARQQKVAHMVLSQMKVLYIYKTMIQAGKITRHKEYEPFLISKKVRGASGVMVVTVATSPWPSSVETEYISNALNQEYVGSFTSTTSTTSTTPSLEASKETDKEALKEAERSKVLHKTDTTVALAKKTKHFSCKYDCFYCPAEPGQPRSYLLKEPGIARANQHRFDPVAQFRLRCQFGPYVRRIEHSS